MASMNREMVPLWVQARAIGMTWQEIHDDDFHNPGGRKTKKAITRAVEHYHAKQRALSRHRYPTDAKLWEAKRHSLPNLIRFAFISDMHIPDHDERAIALAVKLVAKFKPHVVQHGSDAFDFSTISRWEVDPEAVTEDIFQASIAHYARIMSAFNDAAPGAVSPFLMGNHDYRVWSFLSGKAPQVRKTVTQLFAEIVRDAGGLWLGFDFVEYELGKLKVIHGTCATKYAAATNLDKFGRDVVAGHVHRAMTYHKSQDGVLRTSVTSGCLCNLKPSYSQWQQAWQHGIVFVTINQKTGINYFEPLVFQDYSTAWGGKIYKA